MISEVENLVSEWLHRVVLNDIFRIRNMLCGIFNKLNHGNSSLHTTIC